MFKAFDHRDGQDRALKIGRQETRFNERKRGSFAREVSFARRVESEHLVEVFDHGVDRTGLPWISMELLEGEDLAEYVTNNGPMPHDMVARVFEGLRDGLGSLHSEGVLHLDVKPANLFLVRSNGRETDAPLKILDLGVARQTAPGRRSVILSVSFGTESWMAPEQYSLKTSVCAATDVWAMGLVAFYLFTGREYWRHQNGSARDYNPAAAAFEVLHEEAPQASARAVELNAPGALPPGFDEWFSRCLRREPAERYADARRAAQALLDVMKRAEVSVVALPDATGEAGGSLVGEAAAGFIATRPPRPLPAQDGTETTAPGSPSPPQAASSTERYEPKNPGVKPIIPIWTFVACLMVLPGALARRLDPLPEPAPSIPHKPVRQDLAITPSNNPNPRPTPPEHMLAVEGSFRPGRPGNGSAGVVNVPLFYLDQAEVTVRQFRDFWNHGRPGSPGSVVAYPGGYQILLDHPATQPLRNETHPRCTWRVDSGNEDLPLNCVDWYTLQAFCAWARQGGAGGRLPTEVEWELAARGLDDRRFPWGLGGPRGRLNGCAYDCSPIRLASPQLHFYDGVAWVAPPGRFGSTLPPGVTPREDGRGLYDMAGNVAEWTVQVDWRGAPATGVAGIGTLQPTRGGSFLHSHVSAFSTYAREMYDPMNRSLEVGGRCAWSP